MKNSDLKRLAKVASVSETTAYRAISGMAGVSEKTKKRVLDAADALGLDRRKTRRQSCEALIGAALPAKPSYFWGTAISALRQAARAASDLPAGPDVFFSLFGHLSDEEDILRSLDDLLDASVAAHLIVPAATERILKKTEACREKAPVVFLCEHNGMQDAYFVGEDREKSGAMLAEALRVHFPDRRRLLMLQFGDYRCSDIRSAAFLSGVTGQLEAVKTLSFDGKVPYLAAEIARALYETRKTYPFDTVLCREGYLPQACLAVQKLGVKDVICFGFERAGQDSGRYIKSGVLGAYVEQDIAKEAEAAFSLALSLAAGETPPAKEIYIPSRLFVGREHLQDAE